jgi:uncharacterized protein involved in cysteine biosynthesis
MSAAADAPSPAENAPGFTDGLHASLDGFTYMNEHPGLWRYALWPTLLNAALSLAVLVWLVVVAIAIIAWRAGDHGDPTWWTVAREILIGLGLLVLAIGLTLAVWWFAQGVLMGHFYSKLAAKVEEQLGVAPGELHEVSLRYQVIDSAIDTALLLLVLGAFLVLQIIPILGTLVGLVGWVYANGYILGRDVMDHPLKLRGQRRAQRRAFGRTHHRPIIGLGVVVFGLNFLPIIGPMLQTTSVVGAVRLHRRMPCG